MKRALIVGASTIAGVSAAFMYTPHPSQTDVTSLVSTTASSPQASEQTYTGSEVSTEFGIVQVELTADSSGKIVDVKTLQYPNGDPKSTRISEQSIPILTEEALAAQSADISSVSGASYTSDGWIKSLSSALNQAAKGA